MTTDATTIPDDVTSNPNVGKQTGTESSLSTWVGPYVTETLGS